MRGKQVTRLLVLSKGKPVLRHYKVKAQKREGK
jgi:hypothetical protein